MLAYADQKIKTYNYNIEDKKSKRGLTIMSRKEKLYMVFLYCIVFLFYLLYKIKQM
jgi:hypothetical protein